MNELQAQIGAGLRPWFSIRLTSNHEARACHRRTVRPIPRQRADRGGTPQGRRSNLALDEFFAWYGQEPWPGFTKATVAAWHLAFEVRAGGGISKVIVEADADKARPLNRSRRKFSDFRREGRSGD